MIADTESKEYEKGWTDFTMGISINKCPYKSYSARNAWRVGWIEAFSIEEFKNPLVDGSGYTIK